MTFGGIKKMLQLKKSDSPNHDFTMEKLKEAMQKGIRITDDFQQMHSNTKQELRALMQYIESITGISKLFSIDQLRAYYVPILNEDQRKHCIVNGKYTFNKDVLNYLFTQNIPMTEDILQARLLKNKLDVLSGIGSNMDSSNYVHPELTRGKTYRYSYAQPALMNIPTNLVWQLIVPRNAKNNLYAIDIHQQEPYILLHYLNIEKLITLLQDESDLYKAIYKAIFNEQCPSKQHRKELKQMWNALSYGGRKINNLGTIVDGDKVKQFFKSFPEYETHRQRSYYMAKTGVPYRKTYFGTKVYATGTNVSKLARSHMDVPIQGTGADILSFLIEHLYATIEEQNLQGKVEFYFSRHDELILEISPELGDPTTWLNDLFTHQVEDWTPFRVDVTQLTRDITYELEEDDD